jgi:hypothetical protein
LLLHVRVETRHVHAERHLAKAGGSNCKGRGLSHPETQWKGERSEGCTPCGREGRSS